MIIFRVPLELVNVLQGWSRLVVLLVFGLWLAAAIIVFWPSRHEWR